MKKQKSSFIGKLWMIAFFWISGFADSRIDQLVEREFLPFQQGISKEALETTWEQCKKHGDLFRRFRVINNKVYGPESQTKNLLLAIVNKYSVPDVDFIHHNHDILYDSWFSKSRKYAPIFASAKLAGGTRTVLFMDWYYHVNAPGGLDELIENVNREVVNHPWETRLNQAFWRGANNDGYYTPRKWTTIPRGKLVAFSRAMPLLLDAGFTHYHPWNVSNLSFFQNQVGVKPFVPPLEQLRYKYQIDLDGTTPTYPSLHWKLFTESLILKQHPSPKGILWYTDLLIPWEHFVPLRPDLSDLEEKLHWVLQHDEEARAIAIRGKEFAMTHLKQEHILLYCYKMLCRYASLQKFKPRLKDLSK